MLFGYGNVDISMKSSNGNNDIGNEGSELHVRDYVKNVHGGKYNFGVNNNMEGMEFAQSLYASETNCGSELEQLIDPNEELPKWTQRMLQLAIENSRKSDSNAAVVRLGESFEIINEERTWEKFYAFVIPKMGRDEKSPRISVFPETGHLAPRGGAANACDEAKPYLDSADLVVSLLEDDEVKYESIVTNEECCHVVVGTEEATWFYKVLH